MTSPGYLLEMQIVNQKLWRWVQQSGFNKSSRWFWRTLKFENHWDRRHSETKVLSTMLLYHHLWYHPHLQGRSWLAQTTSTSFLWEGWGLRKKDRVGKQLSFLKAVTWNFIHPAVQILELSGHYLATREAGDCRFAGWSCAKLKPVEVGGGSSVPERKK